MAAPPPRRRTPTLADVAGRAGVSLATASKAINGRPDVGEATRARVLEVARQLSFSPNAMALGLINGRSDSVGLLTDDVEGRFALPIMMGVEDALGEAEIVALLVSSRGRADLERSHQQALLRRRVDGLVLVGNAPETRPPLEDEPGVPVVYAYAPSGGAADVSVVPDHRGAGRLAAEHLISLGRRGVAQICGPLEAAVGWTAARQRAEGCAETLAAAGAGADEPLRTGSWTEHWGYDEARRLLAGGTVDGLVCGNDQIARGAVDLLVARGVDVPGEVAVVGFDNSSPLSAHARLPQTSVDTELHEVGRIAARAVLRPGTLAPGEHRVPGRLVVRRSTVAG